MTIDERAHQYGCKFAGGWYKGGIRGSVYEAHHDAYIEIATEQRKIDIDKACEWIQENIVGTNKYITNCCGIDLINATAVDDFRKAMQNE